MTAGTFPQVHVELDPLAEVQVRQAIESRQMRVVGWYHSHPVFAPQPSIRDVQNQANYQRLFHDAASNMMPFVGMIVSPYDTKLSSPSSSLTTFYVEPSPHGSAQGTPMRVTHRGCSLAPLTAALPDDAAAVQAMVAASLPRQSAVPDRPRGSLLLEPSPPIARYWAARLADTRRVLCALVHYYKRHRSRTPLNAVWRKSKPKPEADGGGGAQPMAAAAAAAAASAAAASGGGGSSSSGTSKLEKLSRSVRGRLVEPFGAAAAEEMLAAVVQVIDAHWSSFGGK